MNSVNLLNNSTWKLGADVRKLADFQKETLVQIVVQIIYIGQINLVLCTRLQLNEGLNIYWIGKLFLLLLYNNKQTTEATQPTKINKIKKIN